MQLLTKPFGLPETDWQFSSAITTSTATAARVAGAAGVRNYVTAVQYQNTSATASEIQIQDGAAVVVLPTPLRGTAATALNVQLITTGTNTFVERSGLPGRIDFPAGEEAGSSAGESAGGPVFNFNIDLINDKSTEFFDTYCCCRRSSGSADGGAKRWRDGTRNSIGRG